MPLIKAAWSRLSVISYNIRDRYEIETTSGNRDFVWNFVMETVFTFVYIFLQYQRSLTIVANRDLIWGLILICYGLIISKIFYNG